MKILMTYLLILFATGLALSQGQGGPLPHGDGEGGGGGTGHSGTVDNHYLKESVCCPSNKISKVCTYDGGLGLTCDCADEIYC